MTHDVVIPSLGVGMSEALLVRWLKQPGESVVVDEPIAEIETDKSTLDLASEVDGVMGEHLYQEGATVPVGEAIARVSTGAIIEHASSVPAPDSSSEQPSESTPSTPPLAAVNVSQPAASRAPHAQSPRARRLAAATEQAGNDSGGRFRDAIAAQVTESWRTIPHFTVSREVSAEWMSALIAAERSAGSSVNVTDVLLHALASAHRQTGTSGTVDIGLAVATGNGVAIPVVRDVLGRPLRQLAIARQEAVTRARQGRLAADDLSIIPPSTLSNLGSRGVDQFTGIIALGQQTLLSVGRAIPRVVADADGGISVRRTLFATINADHRLLDGAHAADLLVAFADCLEDRSLLENREDGS